MKGVINITYRKNESSREKKEYKFLNKVYKLSQQGKLTWKRIKWGKIEKIATVVFLISIIVSTSLFIYTFFVSWSEEAFAKKNIDIVNNGIGEKPVEEPSEKILNIDSQEPISTANNFSSEFSDAASDTTNTSIVIDETTYTDTHPATPSTEAIDDSKIVKSTKIEKDEGEEPTQANSQINSSKSDKNAIISSINELAFVSFGGIPLFDSLETKKEVEKVRYGTYVKVIEQKESSGINYSYVAYYDKNDIETMKQGWVKTSNLTFVSKFITSNPFNISMIPFKKISARVKNVRGIYISRATASRKTNLDLYLGFVKRNNLNALVIDVKDDDGTMLFKSDVSSKYAPNANRDAAYTKEEIREIINNLKSQGVYLIARIVCFKDPTYARAHMERAIVFKDTGEPYMGVYKVPWASAYDRELWQYNIDVAKEALEAGFDEIQYDYVRFPELSKAVRDRVNLRQKGNETMAEAIHKFLVQSKKELEHYNVPLTADIFGLVSSVVDDLGIGQHWESISNVIDYVCPMVYPSHYANGSFKLPIPDAYPYETVYNSVLDGIVRNKYLPSPGRIRPWIQAFTATWVKGHIKYGEEEIRKQIKALKDLGINEYMLWNASNRYIEMKYE